MRLLLILTSILFLACQNSTPAPHPPVDTDQCDAMCQHLQKLGCEEGEPLYNNDLPGEVGVPNQSCAANCQELQDRGYFVNPRCVSTVAACEAIEAARAKHPSECK